jgi:hypothetical protein
MTGRDSQTAHVVAWEQHPAHYLTPLAFDAGKALTLCGHWITPSRRATGIWRCGRCLVRLVIDPRPGKHRRPGR